MEASPWLSMFYQLFLKDWRNGLTLLSSTQNLGQKLMQLWMEIKVVTLHKVVETMPQQMHSVIKAKGGLLHKASVLHFILYIIIHSYFRNFRKMLSTRFSYILYMQSSEKILYFYIPLYRYKSTILWFWLLHIAATKIHLQSRTFTEAV